MTETIKEFKGVNRFLSNFWVEEGGTTNEHRFQAAKTNNLEEKQLILNASTPSEAKILGRKVHMRPDWEEVKVSIMFDLLRTKFSNPNLAERLEATGDAELVEGNHWGDTYWGVNIKTGEGKNLLGKLLMQVRNENRSH